MALLIDTSLNVYGIPINQLYLRLKYIHEARGTDIYVELYKFFNKESYQDNEASRLQLRDPKIPDHLNITYDRAADGVDILTHVHNKAIEYLITNKTEWVTQYDPSTGELIYSEVPVLDPSTGKPMTDPSTGKPILEQGDPSMVLEVIQEKFCAIGDVSIVDVSIL